MIPFGGKRARRRRWQYSLQSLLLVMTLLSIPLATVAYVVHQRNAWNKELERREAQNLVVVEQIVADVDALVQRIGRAPKDQDELETLLGKPMPIVFDGLFESPIYYRRTGDASYCLRYELWATDDWIFDSTDPEAGWVQHFY